MLQTVDARDRSLGWIATGTALVRTALAGLDEPAFDAPCALAGWSRRHLAAHLDANADALGNLVRWAATGDRTPMYASPEQRSADIEAGAARSGAELRERFDASAQRLSQAMVGLDPDRWAAQVQTAQGRVVPAALITWMRAREVLVHAVDLGTDLRFADLPGDFLRALGDDVAAARSGGAGPALELLVDDGTRWTVAGTGAPVPVVGPLGELVAYLVGRPAAVGLRALGDDVGGSAPELPAWL